MESHLLHPQQVLGRELQILHILVFFAPGPETIYYQHAAEMVLTNGGRVGAFSFGNCFGFQTNITVTKIRSDSYCNIMLLGEHNDRKLGIWFHPASTKFHVRLKTVCYFSNDIKHILRIVWF